MSRIREFARSLRRRPPRNAAAEPMRRDPRPAPEPQPGPAPDWSELAPESDVRSGHVVELPNSSAEPGGPPVRVDPSMVSPAGAERMRPAAQADDAGSA
jgi:hypothetical protein